MNTLKKRRTIFLTDKDFETLLNYADMYSFGKKKRNLSLLLELLARKGFSLSINVS